MFWPKRERAARPLLLNETFRLGHVHQSIEVSCRARIGRELFLSNRFRRTFAQRET